MLDYIRNHPRLTQVFLALIALPFIFTGVDFWLNDSRAQQSVATAGGVAISQELFQRELAGRLDQMRSRLGERYKRDEVDTPALRRSIAEQLVEKQLLLLEASKQRFVVSVEAIRDNIAKIPEFQEGGKFSGKRYEEVLKSIGKTPQQFETEYRETVLLQQLVGGIEGSALQSHAIAEAIIAEQTEQRRVAEFRLPLADYLGEAKVDNAAIKAYYDAHPSEFAQKERVKLQYVILSAADLEKDITLSEADLKAAFEANQSAYETPEKRDASHILFAVTSPADKDKVKARANEMLNQLRQQPSQFAEMAKAHSQDPGSAAKGGELGFFGRGDMVKPFEDAAFALKIGEISPLVESDFGFHIIRLNAIQARQLRPFAEVRSRIESDKKRELAQRKFTELADQFDKIVYEQSDSLAPVANKLHLTVKDSNWIEQGTPPADPLLTGNEVTKAMFDSDATVKKRNSKAIEVAPQTLLSLRVVDHKAASTKPFADVSGAIRQKLLNEAAQKLAQTAGEKRLAEIKAGKAQVNWTPEVLVRRVGSLPKEAQKAVFKTSVAQLPAYTGAIVADAYVIYKIAGVSHPTLDDNQKKAIMAQLEGIVQQESVREYLQALKQRYGFRINDKLLDAKRDAG